jgi:hypothetical protein
VRTLHGLVRRDQLIVLLSRRAFDLPIGSFDGAADVGACVRAYATMLVSSV